MNISHLGKIFTFLAASVIFTNEALSGTLVLATKGATEDNSVFLAYSVDKKADPNLRYVEAKDHDVEALREIYFDSDPKQAFLGTIPEAAHTFAYLDSEYGLINEKGLMAAVSEAYTQRNVKTKYSSYYKAIFCPKELIKVALERCVTALDAATLITRLIDEYGLYGKPVSVVFADRNEAYLVEMMPTPSGRGGFYAVRRVPDGEVFVTADQFRIQDLKKEDPDFIISSRVETTLREAGYTVLAPRGNINWLRSVKGVEKKPYYSMRRVWRVLSLVAPSQELPAWVSGYEDKTYPFSIRPDKPLALTDIMEIMRDTYTGTSFDNATKATGGLFASPYTYEDYGERSISTGKTTYTFIGQLNENLITPVIWVSLGASGESAFVPLTVDAVPDTFSGVSREEYDESKMWWISNNISHLTRGYYSALSDLVRMAILEQEQRSITLIKHSESLPLERFKNVIRNNVNVSYNRTRKLFERVLEVHDGGYMLKYAEGHLPNFTPVDHYHKPAPKAPAEKKTVQSKPLVTSGIPFMNAVSQKQEKNDEDLLREEFFRRFSKDMNEAEKNQSPKN